MARHDDHNDDVPEIPALDRKPTQFLQKQELGQVNEEPSPSLLLLQAADSLELDPDMLDRNAPFPNLLATHCSHGSHGQW